MLELQCPNRFCQTKATTHGIKYVQITDDYELDEAQNEVTLESVNQNVNEIVWGNFAEAVTLKCRLMMFILIAG